MEVSVCDVLFIVTGFGTQSPLMSISAMTS